MKNTLLILAIAFQLIALSWMALSREYILLTGKDIKFQTAPIDPRDLFRGDFVRLKYAMSEVPTELLNKNIHLETLKKGQVLYVTLTASENDIYSLNSVSLEPPENQLYIKGRLKRGWKKYQENRRIVQLKYGIEQYFVEQGKGIELEKKRGNRNSIQIPMIMNVALSDSGTAILKSHEWSNLGIGLVATKTPEQKAPDDLASAHFKLSLKNVSNKNIQLPLKPGNCSFFISATKSSPEALKRRPKDCEDKMAIVKVLKPTEMLDIDIDFNDPHWWFEHKKVLTPIGKLPWNYRFRFIYDETSEIRNDSAIEIVSRAFHGRGRID